MNMQEKRVEKLEARAGSGVKIETYVEPGLQISLLGTWARIIIDPSAVSAEFALTLAREKFPAARAIFVLPELQRLEEDEEEEYGNTERSH